jgi:TolA-binding protein
MIDRKIEIHRNIIERFLMAVKKLVKENKKNVIILSTLVLILLVIIVSGIAYIHNREKNEIVKMETILENYYSKEKDKETNFNKTIDELNYLVDSSFSGYVNSFGYYIIAGLYLSQKKYSEGKDYLLKFVDKSHSSSFAPLALHQAAIACEKLNDVNGALIIFQRIEKEYKNSLISDEMSYDIGRMYQIKEDMFKAREYYNKVISESPVSIYASKAKKRLLLLGYNKGEVKKTM